MGTRFARLALTITFIAGLLVSTVDTAAAASDLDFLDEIASDNRDLGSTADEWSGATYNADSHVLFTVDDEHNAYEFALDADGLIDHSVTPRILEIALGTFDFEGVAWISGQTYAFLSEGSGEVIIADVPVAGSGVTTIGTSAIDRSFPVISGNWGNLGPEGLATDGSNFYVVREMPATLSKFDWDGNFVGSVSLTELADASGVAVLVDGSFLVISHESKIVSHYEVDWSTESVIQVGSRSAGFFVQLEGIAVMGNSDIHLFGEDKSSSGRPGQTYSHLNGVIITNQYSASDLNCSGTLTIADAIIVTKIETGLMTALPGCGSGDHNGDGQVNIVDAVGIAQCQVGLYNVGCPGPIG